MSLVVATRAKLDPNLRSLSRIRYFGVSPYGVASRSGTRHPGIGRRSCHIHVNHLPRLQLDNEEGEKWTKDEIGHLQKITGPYLCCMIAEKRFPVLSTGMFWANMSHILLNRAFDFSEYPA
jgi:hypothetical protein